MIDPASCDRASRLPVSVIVPAFNAAATLPRALTSVFAQTRLPAEVIVVDDASSDQTWDVLRQFCFEHPELQVKTLRLERNGGVAGARNAGWGLAAQEYIAFLDADDAWHPRKLELQHRWMSGHPKVMLCGHRCIVFGSHEEEAEFTLGNFPVQYFALGKFLVANRLSTPSVMLRRSLAERFEPGKRYSEDYLLWMQIVANHGAAAYIDLPLAILYKARYGVTGLSGDLWRSHLGEIDTLYSLRRDNYIGGLVWASTLMWSWAKFIKRAAFRKISSVPLSGRKSNAK